MRSFVDVLGRIRLTRHGFVHSGVVENLGEFKGKHASKELLLASRTGIPISDTFTPSCASELLDPGLHCMLWPLQCIVGRMSLRIQQLNVTCETKTKDNVFIQVAVAVQYRVIIEGAYNAWYRLTDARSQIQSYVFDVVRSTIPKMELDEAFASKDDIAKAVLESLQRVMQEYGYEIRATLVTDLMPDAKVRSSMNEINASKRLKVWLYRQCWEASKGWWRRV